MEGWKIHREGLKGMGPLLGFHLISKMILESLRFTTLPKTATLGGLSTSKIAPSRGYWLRKQHQNVNAENLARKYKPASEHHGSQR